MSECVNYDNENDLTRSKIEFKLHTAVKDKTNASCLLFIVDPIPLAIYTTTRYIHFHDVSSSMSLVLSQPAIQPVDKYTFSYIHSRYIDELSCKMQ